MYTVQGQFTIIVRNLISYSLLIQFDDMGDHGTKIIVFNLWFNDDGDMELDFNSDKKVSNVVL